MRAAATGGRYSSEVPFGLGIWEILILAGVLVLLFGAKGAPGMARRLGLGVREMKDAVSEMDPRSLLDPKSDQPKTSPPPGRELAAATSPTPPSAPAATAPPADEPPPG
jgi:sec-independent protein translocase protein TatA